MEEKNKTKIYNLVILDKSGSMQSIRKEAVDGFNETLGSIKATQLKLLDTQEHYVSLAAFCGCGIDMIYDMTPIKDADIFNKSPSENHPKYLVSSSSFPVPETTILKNTTITDIIE